MLPDTGLTDEALVTFARLGGLTYLQSFGNSFTDGGVQILVALQRLELLFLEETTLTAAAFGVTRGLPNLMTLGCQDAALTADEVEELQGLSLGSP